MLPASIGAFEKWIGMMQSSITFAGPQTTGALGLQNGERARCACEEMWRHGAGSAARLIAAHG